MGVDFLSRVVAAGASNAGEEMLVSKYLNGTRLMIKLTLKEGRRLEIKSIAFF